MYREDRLIKMGRLNPTCEHPERYTATVPALAEHQVQDFLVGLVRALQPDHVLETGTSLGETAARLGTALRQNGQGELWTIEQSDTKVEHARPKVEGLPVTIIHGDANTWEPPSDVRFALAYFDTDGKDYLTVQFLRYWRFMTSASFAVFHDTSPYWPTRPLIERLEGRGILRCIDLPTPRGLTVGQVLKPWTEDLATP